ncbi:MAG: hypothetical protein ACYC6G_19470 [Desulfobaccales bacterium]
MNWNLPKELFPANLPKKCYRIEDAPLYQQKPISIRELWEQKLTREKSQNALRDRAEEGFLVYLRDEGRTSFYDLQLSVVRLNAARQCKRPKITWGLLKIAIGKLDSAKPELNEEIINLLNNNHTEKEAVQAISESIINQLRTDGHIA